ncbi:DUF2071 domain-containing protein [bacterium]|nr:DUF2071 domain-containing protein [bacterium]
MTSSLPDSKNWIIQQTWEHVLFIHFWVNADELQKLLPAGLEVDTLHDEAFVSIVPFQMSRVRFPLSPILPFSKLWELNLRTYVKHKGSAGIYFFTLDSDHKLANWIARRFFCLPYRYAKLSGHITSDSYEFDSENSLSLIASIDPDTMNSSNTQDLAKHRWLTERYRLFTETPNGIATGEVLHESWKLQSVKIENFENNFSSQFKLPLETKNKSQYFGSTYSKELLVRFKPFRI